MKFVTTFEFTIEHLAPLDPERLGKALSRATQPVMEAKPFKGNTLRTTMRIVDYNKLVP